MDYSRTRLLIFGLGDTHWVESRQGAKDGSSNPCKLFSLGRGPYSYLCVAGSKRSDFLVKSFRESREHSSASTQYNMAVKIFSDVFLAIHNRPVGQFVHSGHFLSY